MMASKWAASGWWWRGGLRARSHTGFSLPFHTNALIDWCGSTGNAASVWTVEMSYAEALRHQGLPCKVLSSTSLSGSFSVAVHLWDTFYCRFFNRAAGSNITHADSVPVSTSSSGLHGFWIHKRLCRSLWDSIIHKVSTHLSLLELAWDTNKSAAFSATC